MNQAIKLKIQRPCAVFVAVFWGILAFVPAQAAKAEVVSKLEAFTVLVGQDGKEYLKETDRITPGGMIEYHISYENKTDGALNNFIVNGGVPASTHFVANTEDLNQSGVFEAEIAKLGWQEVPVYQEIKTEDGSFQKIEIPPSEYLSIRWRVAKPIAPGKAVEASYRIQVER